MTYVIEEEKLTRFEEKAIEVPYIKNIPSDYWGVIGVPITIMTKAYRNKFDILGMLGPKIGEKNLYNRILIRRKMSEEEYKAAVIGKVLINLGIISPGFGKLELVIE